jgi:hypothetical protein
MEALVTAMLGAALLLVAGLREKQSVWKEKPVPMVTHRRRS